MEGIRYNEHGIAGLSDLPKRGGAAPKLSIERDGRIVEKDERAVRNFPMEPR